MDQREAMDLLWKHKASLVCDGSRWIVVNLREMQFRNSGEFRMFSAGIHNREWSHTVRGAMRNWVENNLPSPDQII